MALLRQKCHSNHQKAKIKCRVKVHPFSSFCPGLTAKAIAEMASLEDTLWGSEGNVVMLPIAQPYYLEEQMDVKLDLDVIADGQNGSQAHICSVPQCDSWIF